LNLFSAGGDFLSEAVMQESSVYEHLLQTADEERYQQGIQQGARQTALESLFAALEFRFDSNAVHMLQPTLETINDVQHLKRLLPKALRAQSLEAFVHTLDMNDNE
jgi:hypothetical protein